MFSFELKILDFINTQQMFQRLENVGHLKKNAYFYSCFFKVAVEKKYYEDAKRFLKRGLDNMAQPSAIISSAFKQLASISLQNRNKENIEESVNQSKNLIKEQNISLQNQNKENIVQPANKEGIEQPVIKSVEQPVNQNQNLVIEQSPIPKPSLSILRKTIQTPPTRKINIQENLKRISYLPPEEKVIEFPKEEDRILKENNSKTTAPSTSPLKIQNPPKEQGSPPRKKKKI
jgi:hypothetical protein